MKMRISPVTAVVLAAILIVTAAAFYELILPARMASGYLGQLDESGQQLKTSFKSVGKTTNLTVFNNPDLATQSSQQDFADIDADIEASRKQLAAFGKASNKLTRLPITGYTGSMHTALVQQKHAHTIIAESNDVLNRYQQLSDFLKTYYAYDAAFQSYTSAANNAANLDALAPETAQLTQQATQLHQFAAALSSAKVPAGYEQLVTTAVPAYNQAAQGLNQLADGLSSGNDDSKDAGIRAVEAAAQTRDANLEGLPVSLSQHIYVFQEVSELPDKIENLFS